MSKYSLFEETIIKELFLNILFVYKIKNNSVIRYKTKGLLKVTIRNWKRALTPFTEVLGLFARTHIRQHTTICGTSFRESDTFFWPL